MLTEYETHTLRENVCRESDALAMKRLVRDMGGEPASRPGVLPKCVLCLVIFAGLALMGARTDLLTASAQIEESQAVEPNQSFDELGLVPRAKGP